MPIKEEAKDRSRKLEKFNAAVQEYKRYFYDRLKADSGSYDTTELVVSNYLTVSFKIPKGMVPDLLDKVGNRLKNNLIDAGLDAGLPPILDSDITDLIS